MSEREYYEKWLAENAPYVFTERGHFVKGSREEAYWHFGFLWGLKYCDTCDSPTPATMIDEYGYRVPVK